MIDTDKDGTLDRKEILHVFEKSNGRGSKALRYFSTMDANRDGAIGKEEYLKFWTQLASSVSET